MAATNQTTNYALPLFTAENHPEWLVDWNNAMTKLDSTIKNAFDQIETGVSDGSEIKEEIAEINTTLDTMTTDVGNIKTTLESFNNLEYTSEGLSSTHLEVVGGGYAKLGNLVVVNIRFKFKTDVADNTNVFLSGFPTYNVEGADDIVRVACDGNSLKCSLFDSGIMRINTIGNKTANRFETISTCYIAEGN